MYKRSLPPFFERAFFTKDTISLIVLATILFFPVARFAAACSVKGTRPVPVSPVEAVLFCPAASTAPAERSLLSGWDGCRQYTPQSGGTRPPRCVIVRRKQDQPNSAGPVLVGPGRGGPHTLG